jgi:protein involved in polysaccharide export with SLBB domain
MINLLFVISFFVVSLYGVELSTFGYGDNTKSVENLDTNNTDINATDINNTDVNTSIVDNNITIPDEKKVFGYNLFSGSFSNISHYRYNPDYLINVGDTISIKMWGAYEIELKVDVDSKGNIFIPKVGIVNVLGIKNEYLTSTIEKSVHKSFRDNVSVYADLDNYNPVSLFITGAVNKPGLYEGLSSDSIIQYLDKANGIDIDGGSYRSIKVLRKNKIVKEIDLYKFLLGGSLEAFQFRNGDVVIVGNIKHYLEISGDVKRPYRYEMLKDNISLRKIVEVVIPNPTATNIIITKYNQENEKIVDIYNIDNNLDMIIKSGCSVEFISDYIPRNITITISGEHENTHNVIVEKGTTLKTVLDTILMTDLSAKNSFQLYRKSVAQQQKSLINAQLDDLAAKTLAEASLTLEDARIRQEESMLVLNFIDRVKQVEPKGQVVINSDTNLSKVLLEDMDEIHIPKKSNVIIVQGEVMLPGAQTYVSGMTLEDYIDSCGGYNDRADTDQVLIIKDNGQVVLYDSGYPVSPGDAILVLGKIDSKYIQVFKDITQIIYQLVVSASILITF